MLLKIKKMLPIFFSTSLCTIILFIITFLKNNKKVSDFNPFYNIDAFLMSCIICIVLPFIVSIIIYRITIKNIPNKNKIIVSVIIFLFYFMYFSANFISRPF